MSVSDRWLPAARYRAQREEAARLERVRELCAGADGHGPWLTLAGLDTGQASQLHQLTFGRYGYRYDVLTRGS
jgi:hypothetical protein